MGMKNQIKDLRKSLMGVTERLKQGNIDDVRMATNYKLIFKEINFIDSLVVNNVQYIRDNDLLISFLHKVYSSLLEMGVDEIKTKKDTIIVKEELQDLEEANNKYKDHMTLADKHRAYFEKYIRPQLKP